MYLRERFHYLQGLALILCFLGVYVMQGYDASNVNFTVLVGLGTAVFSALTYNIIRQIGSDEDPLVVMIYFPFVATTILAPYVVFHWTQPVGVEWLLLLTIGISTQFAQWFMTRAYAKEAAANFIYWNYLGLISAATMGYLFFDEILSWTSLAGIVLVCFGVFMGIVAKKLPVQYRGTIK